MRNFVLLICFSLCSTWAIGQKKVLLEKFTNAFCGSCPDATITLEGMINDYPDLIWISHHKPISWSETHPLPNDQSTAIWDALNIAGVPTGMIDRTLYDNRITMNRSTWKQRVESHLQLPSVFDISIEDVSYESNLREINFDVSTATSSESLQGPFRITAYIVEDSVIGGQHSYWNDVPGHPLEGKGDIIWSYYHRNVVRAILDNHWGSSDVIPDQPNQGEVYSQNYTYTIPVEYSPENIKLVAMVSKFDEGNNFPGVVENATQINLDELGIKLTNTSEIEVTDISIAPNPASDFLNVTFSAVPSNVLILSIDGTVVSELNPESVQTKISLESFISGSYYLVSEMNGRLHGTPFSVMK